MKRFMGFVFLLGFIVPLWAWHAPGHCVVALIAYDRLTPAAKTQVDALIQTLPPIPGQANDICAAANWADSIRSQQILAFSAWHFIDQRLTLSGKPKHHNDVANPNVVWAINQAEVVLMSPTAQMYEKAWFLRFLLHFVGDIHQPLHTTSLFNQQFPRGDKGGNLYLITSPLANNLHSLWDQGVGLVPDDMSRAQIQALVRQLEQQYPPSYFGAAVNDLDSRSWAGEGFRIVRADVYTQASSKCIDPIAYGGAPSPAYVIQGQQIAGERLTLAGYRLANVLNLWAAGK